MLAFLTPMTNSTKTGTLFSLIQSCSCLDYLDHFLACDKYSVVIVN